MRVDPQTAITLEATRRERAQLSSATARPRKNRRTGDRDQLGAEPRGLACLLVKSPPMMRDLERAVALA